MEGGQVLPDVNQAVTLYVEPARDSLLLNGTARDQAYENGATDLPTKI